MRSLEDAIKLAVDAHSGQLDKAGQPYILHPLRVMSQVSELNERIAAVLHDVVEDTEVTLEDLRSQGFPSEVVEAIDALTKRPGEKRMQAARRAGAHPIARMVKIADVMDNLDSSRLPQLTREDERRLKEYREVLSYLQSCGPMPIRPPRESRNLVDVDLDNRNHTRIDVEITDEGLLVLSGQDVGETTEKYWGDEDYEYWLVVQAPDKDRVLLALIDKLFRGNPTLVSELKGVLDEEGIPSTFASYV